MKRVLIGFAESLAAIESAWCLRDAGFEVVAFARAGRRPPLASVRGVRTVPVPAPEDDLAATVDALRRVTEAEDPVAVLPLDDHAVWLTDRLAGPAHAGTGDAAACRSGGGRPAIAGPTGPQATLALDKREQLDQAAKAGLSVPPTVGAQETPPGLGPWMVKPALATVNRDGKLLRPAGTVATQAADIAAIAGRLDSPVLVQPLLDGVGEGLFGFAAGGDVTVLSMHRRVRMMNPRGSGSSACRSIPVEPALVEPARRFLAEAGWHGIFMLELLRDHTGKHWFMELNGRAWGSMALATRRGLAYPQWAVAASVDRAWRPPPVPDPPHLLCRHLGREIVHLLAVLRGGRGTDAGRWPSRRRTLAALLRVDRDTRWYNARRDEPAVLARDTWTTIVGQAHR